MIGLALTPEQFKILLRMVYIANTVANGHSEEGEFLKDYDDLEQYIFSRAKEAGFPGATERHKVDEEVHHHPSPMFENDAEVNKILDEYDTRATFEFLGEKLAERDLEKKYGPHAKDRMPAKDYEEILTERTEEYILEFDDFGFTKIHIDGMEGDINTTK